MFFPVEGPPSPAFKQAVELFVILASLGICGVSFNWTQILWDEDRSTALVALSIGCLMIVSTILLISGFIWEHLLKKRHAKTRASRTI